MDLKIINHTNYKNKTVFKGDILRNVSKSDAAILITADKAVEYKAEDQEGQTIEEILGSLKNSQLIKIAKDFDIEFAANTKKDLIITELLSAGIDEEYLETQGII